MKLSPDKRLDLINKALEKSETVSSLCQKTGISRKTFYKWYKRYRNDYRKNGLATLANKKWKLKRHGRRAPDRVERKILVLISQKPTISYSGLSKLLAEDFGRNSIGRHGIQNILSRYNLRLLSQRYEFARMKRVHGLTPQERFLLFERTIKERVPVIRACKELNISRKTYYKWLKRNGRRGEVQLANLENKKWMINDHPRRLTSEKEEIIVNTVIASPHFSCRKLADVCGIGNHGVQNFLARRNLRRQTDRMIYSTNSGLQLVSMI